MMNHSWENLFVFLLLFASLSRCCSGFFPAFLCIGLVADDNALIQLPSSVRHDTLLHVVDYLNYHRDRMAPMIDRPLRTPLEDVICDWDREFLTRFERPGLFDLANGSYFLGIAPLMELTCAQIASNIRGMSPEQIRETFGIHPFEVTPDEEARIREENKWCEDC